MLLVDANLRQPIIHTLLHLSNDAGLGKVLTELARVTSPMPIPLQVVSALPELAVLTAGRANPLATDLLDSPSLARFFEMAEQQRMPLMIITLGNALSAPDAAILSARVDGVLLVANATQTRLPALKAVVTKLRRAGAQTLGVVLANMPDYSEATSSLMVPTTVHAGEL